ncbi:DNA polymerase III subunit delta' [Methyloligella solikamskensis]|uniref:DNA polymerase III subunit delta n=1 Tax=Methyloligella solikamskensis TaxID=1177756 RepID=A0ABW3JBK9_9HYPH
MAAADSKARDEEPDRLAGFPAPRETHRLYGHEDPRAQFERALGEDRLHHGWLISGPEGIGKATLAYTLAREVLAHDRAGDDPDDPEGPLFHQVAGRAHPNLLILNRTFNPKTKRYSQWIGVDEVRRLRSFLGGTAAQSGWRVIIVDRADELNAQAANALLKGLEEPPAKTVFLLVATAEGRLPVTIRSRCRSLRLHPLEDEEVDHAAREALAAVDHTLDEETLQTAIALAEGSVRRALVLTGGEGIALYGEILQAFRNLPKLDAAWLHKKAEKLSAPGNTEQLELFFALLLGLLERLIRARATETGRHASESALADDLIRDDDLGRWAEAWEAIGKAHDETLGLNLDRGVLVLDSFSRLQSLAERTNR